MKLQPLDQLASCTLPYLLRSDCKAKLTANVNCKCLLVRLCLVLVGYRRHMSAIETQQNFGSGTGCPRPRQEPEEVAESFEAAVRKAESVGLLWGMARIPSRAITLQ
jgi:hypothetical protein